MKIILSLIAILIVAYYGIGYLIQDQLSRMF